MLHRTGHDHSQRTSRARIARLALLTSIAIIGRSGAHAAEPDPRATASAWPQFKGDAARSGDNPLAGLTLPLSRVMAVRFPAAIYASPAVIGDRVFVQDARGHLACVDGTANRVVWTAENGGINNSSSPAVFDGKVYVGSTAGHLAIHDAATGVLITRVPAGSAVIASPAVANGAIYFSTFDGKLTKVRPDGTIVWTFDGGQTSITEFAVKGERIVFFAGTRQANAYRLRDAGDAVEMIERGRPNGGYFAPTGGPVFLGDDDYACQSYDSESGWFHGMGVAIDSGSNDSRIVPSVRGDLVYRGNKCFEFDLTTKKHRERWRSDPDALYDGGFHSSPALAKSLMVIGSERGIVHFLPLDAPETAVPTARQPLQQFAIEGAGRPNGAVSSSPAVIDGRVYFGGEDGILYGLGTGAEAAIVKAPFDESRWKREPVKVPAGREWVTTGGDMGFSCVAQDSPVKPPFQTRWRTRIWSTHKGNMVVAAGKVFAAGRMGPLTAVDAETGEIVWKTHHAGVESRPSPTYADGRLYLLRNAGGLKTSPYFRGWYGGPNGQGLYCHDPATGELLWHKPIPAAYAYNSDGVVAADGRVFVCQDGDDGRLAAVACDGKTGDVLWRRNIEGIEAIRLWKSMNEIRRFAGVLTDGLWCVSIRGTESSPGATLALDQKTGDVVWRNDEVFIQERSRIASRNGTLVVFDAAGSHGFEARTGKPLWTGGPIDPESRKEKPSTTFYMHALTDRFLESRGREDVFHISGCILPVYANGLWYSHTTNKTQVLHVHDGSKTVWSRTFLSHACPSPAPAYDRLYYSPNSEGVIYCFENEPAVGN